MRINRERVFTIAVFCAIVIALAGAWTLAVLSTRGTYMAATTGHLAEAVILGFLSAGYAVLAVAGMVNIVHEILTGNRGPGCRVCQD